MEKEGLRRSLNYLLERNVSIITIATDRQKGVGALMKTEYPYISHQYDVWHMAKGVVKQLIQKGKLKHCERLLPWIQSISIITYGGLHRHAMEMHNFLLKSGPLMYTISVIYMNGMVVKVVCSVSASLPLEEQHSKKWLRFGSLVDTTLKNIVYNKTLLWDIKMITSFHHTGPLEVFHSMLLKYCPKR